MIQLYHKEDRKTTDNFSPKETTPKTNGLKINALMGERLLALLEKVPSESQFYLQSMAEGLEISRLYHTLMEQSKDQNTIEFSPTNSTETTLNQTLNKFYLKLKM
ncbi:uncharacterized protein LOC135922292 [Gordionus sp. m RMFG-2023]|uniref:uncharacterized protein LOC135922292 n=1 Tax=Gordionus sp. m RMFG-2023 TaxID=3053472 RepID=UPI0031FDBA50